MSSRRATEEIVHRMDAWEKTATDRDVQYQLLRVAVETREKVDTIRSIMIFFVVLWLISVVAAVVASAMA